MQPYIHSPARTTGHLIFFLVQCFVVFIKVIFDAVITQTSRQNLTCERNFKTREKFQILALNCNRQQKWDPTLCFFMMEWVQMQGDKL